MNAPADPMKVQIHRLDNGLTVYLSENRELPRISIRVAVKAGAAEDPTDRTGIAHYLEHMLANKGTTRLGTTDFAAESPHLDEIRALYDRLITAPEDERAAIYAQIDAAGLAASRFAVPNELKQVYGLERPSLRRRDPRGDRSPPVTVDLSHGGLLQPLVRARKHGGHPGRRLRQRSCHRPDPRAPRPPP